MAKTASVEDKIMRFSIECWKSQSQIIQTIQPFKIQSKEQSNCELLST